MYLIYNQKNVIVDTLDELHFYKNDLNKGGTVETDRVWEGEFIKGSDSKLIPVYSYNLDNLNSVRAYEYNKDLPVDFVANEFKIKFNERPEEVKEDFEEIEIGTAFDTNVEHREYLYNNATVITFDDKIITITEAGTLFAYYLAEGNTTKTEELTKLIAEAKKNIREQYPD